MSSYCKGFGLLRPTPPRHGCWLGRLARPMGCPRAKLHSPIRNSCRVMAEKAVLSVFPFPPLIMVVGGRGKFPRIPLVLADMARHRRYFIDGLLF